MNVAEETEARIRDIVDHVSPGAKSSLLSEIQKDMERSKILTEFISLAPGAFCVTQLSRDINIQQDYLNACETLVAMGRLNRHGNKRGWYIPLNQDLKEMDFINADDDPIDIWLPFGINKMVDLFPGNIIIIAGCKNAGKTALMLNIIKENINRFNVNYFNSEMSGGELKTRLKKFDYMTLDMWDMKAYERAGDFQDVVVPGEGNLNIIDFLEVHEEFYIVGKRLKEIHDRLNGAIGIVAIQKNPGLDVGIGGFRSLEVSRLALSLDYGKIKIVVAKNFPGEDSPSGLVRNFKIVHGSQLIEKNGWYRDNRKD